MQQVCKNKNQSSCHPPNCNTYKKGSTIKCRNARNSILKMPSLYEISPKNKPKTIVSKIIKQEIWSLLTIGRIDNKKIPYTNKQVALFLSKNKKKLESIKEEYLNDLNTMQPEEIPRGSYREYIYDEFMNNTNLYPKNNEFKNKFN